MKIRVSYGYEEIGTFDSHTKAVDAAGEYAFKKEMHHKFDWADIRRRVGVVSENSSFGMNGFLFLGVIV